MTAVEAKDQVMQRFEDPRCSKVSQVLSIFSNKLRFKTLCALYRHDFSVSELVSITESSVSNMSQQLKMMYMAGLLEKRRDGKKIVYKLKDQKVRTLIETLETIYS